MKSPELTKPDTTETQIFPAVGQLVHPRYEPVEAPRPRLTDILEEHMPPERSVGLGREVVRSALQHAYYSVEGSADHLTSNERQQKTVQAVRNRLGALTPDQARQLQELLLKEPQSAWLQQKLEVDYGHAPTPDLALVMRLISKQDGEYVIPDEVLVNFLEWHNHAIAARQKELDNRIDHIKRLFINDIHYAVQKGRLDRSILKKLSRLEDTRVVVDDGLLTDLESVDGIANTVAASGEMHVVTLSPSKLEDPRAVLWHEFIHILDGHSDDMDREAKGGVFSSVESHGLHRVFGSGLGGTVLNEAMVERVSMGVLYHNDLDEMEIIDHSHLHYDGGEKLITVLMNEGVRKIGLRSFVGAHFEDMDEAMQKGEDADMYRLIQGLLDAFPFTDVIQEIRDLKSEADVEAYAKSLKRRARRYKLLRQGRIRTKGRHAA